MDHIADLNLTTFHRINQQHVLPDFVKAASIDRDAVTKLPGSSFADPVNRRFPCHTRADTFLSYAYFLKHASLVDKRIRATVYDRLQKFASDWAIYLECKQFERAHNKQAEVDPGVFPDKDFAIVEQFRGEPYRALPLLNEKCVKAAADNLYEYRDRYPLPWRKRAAERILRRAEEWGVSLDKPTAEYLLKASGERMMCLPTLARGILDRSRFIAREHRDAPEYEAMGKLAQTVIKKQLAPEHSTKIASLIDKFDARFGLKRLYSRGLPAPEELVYCGATIKEAEDLKNNLVTLTNGSQYTKSALSRAGLEPYYVLGKDFVSAVSDGLDLNVEKLAQIVKTLPRTDADLLDRALRATNTKTATEELRDAGIPSKINEWSAEDWQKAARLSA